LAERKPRERWLIVLVGLVLSAIVIDLAVIDPLSERADLAEAKAAQLERDVARALRIASEVRMLQGELASVEPRIRSGERTNLLSELEKMAAAAAISESQLESIKERRASANPRYPETRVEVSLRGATLQQAVDYLYRIETAPILLIVRSLRLRARGGPEELVDVQFAVSTFERI
jgi:type II secretory pathway component PulM